MLRLHKPRVTKSQISMLNNLFGWTNGPTQSQACRWAWYTRQHLAKDLSNLFRIQNRKPQEQSLRNTVTSIKPKGTRLMCVELSEEWSRISQIMDKKFHHHLSQVLLRIHFLSTRLPSTPSRMMMRWTIPTYLINPEERKLKGQRIYWDSPRAN